jgi:hypothetical protein
VSEVVADDWNKAVHEVRDYAFAAFMAVFDTALTLDTLIVQMKAAT